MCYHNDATKNKLVLGGSIMERENEIVCGLGGMIVGVVTGAVKGAHIGIEGGPVGAIADTIPGAIIGGIIGLLGGDKIGSEIDRR